MSPKLAHADTLLQPHIGGLIPAVLYSGLPHDPSAVADALGLSEDQLACMRGGALQAELDVPEGAWRVWPERGIAAWLARRRGATVPPTPGRLDHFGLDLLDATTRLLRHGLWCSEVRLLDHCGWAAPQPIRDGLERLVAAPQNALGISALWSDGDGGAIRVELFQNGSAWAPSPGEAERWLLLAAGLADE